MRVESGVRVAAGFLCGRLNPRGCPSKLLSRYLIVAFLIGFCLVNYALYYDTQNWDRARLRISPEHGVRHPIQKLMVEAKAEHDALLAKRSYDIYSAASRYRTKRRRHPPPGFDKWVKAAVECDAIIVEEFFDRIYKDIAPFWALDSDTISRRANSWHWVVRVRNGIAYGDGNTEGRVAWLQLWSDLVREFAEHMPDVDMPINYMDEPRLLVPSEDIAKLVTAERKHRAMPSASNVTTSYQSLGEIDRQRGEPYEPNWSGGDQSYWELAVKTCDPQTPAFSFAAEENLSAPVDLYHEPPSSYTYQGFIRNWTAAMDFCIQPSLRGLHGTFVEPISLSSTDELVPLFGGSKLTRNNEILIPGAMYLTDNDFYSGGTEHGPAWHNKKTGVVWRGAASGGRLHEDTWHRFQRLRLVDMLNATTVTRVEQGGPRSPAFEMPPLHLYPSERRRNGLFGSWLRKFADVGFGWICDGNDCNFLEPFFHRIPEIPMKDQYNYKFLPDVDGNSFSARFRGFMRSTSLPLKATIYAEWHDDRLKPWVHFVPLDNTFRDLYGLLEYFGDENGPGDAAAQFIAGTGQRWAEKVLRRDDMKLYVWRVLLEWARVCDPNRDTLGFVDDLRDDS